MLYRHLLPRCFPGCEQGEGLMDLLRINSISLALLSPLSNALWILKHVSFKTNGSIEPESILRIVLFLQRLQLIQSPCLIPIEHL